MTLSRVPSFSDRPGFPAGLKVLVVDPNIEDLKLATTQLQDCSYEVHGCSSQAEALKSIQCVDDRFDVIMCETSVVAQSENSPSCLVSKIGDVPLILMGENSTEQQLKLGVTLGAVDFLEKPISALKLRNIWQHTVRKMMKVKGGRRKSKAFEFLSKSPAGRLVDKQSAQSLPDGQSAAEHSIWDRKQESTGSSEADTAGGKHSVATPSSTSVHPSAGMHGCQIRRSSSQPARSQTSSAMASPMLGKTPNPPQYPTPNSMQVCMQGMPAPLPGCVWGLPMLPPPVPGLMSAPVPWPAPAPMSPYGMQPVAQPMQWTSKAPAPTSSPAPTYGTLPPMQRAGTAPQGTLPGMPPLAASIPKLSPSHPQRCDTPATACASASNEQSEHTWHQQADWPAMDEMFDLDDPDDPQDIGHLLSSAAEFGLRTDFSLNTPDAAAADRGPPAPADDFDAAFSLLDEDDPIGLKGLTKTPSFLDIMDNWGNDGEVTA